MAKQTVKRTDDFLIQNVRIGGLRIKEPSPYTDKQGRPSETKSYFCKILIDRKDEKTVEMINNKIVELLCNNRGIKEDAAKKELAALSAQGHVAIKDGDGVFAGDNPHHAGHFFINAYRHESFKPPVCRIGMKAVSNDHDDLYAGMIANVIVYARINAQDRVSIDIVAIQKIGKGERISSEPLSDKVFEKFPEFTEFKGEDDLFEGDGETSLI